MSKIKGLRSFNNWVKSSIIQKFIGDERNLKILDVGCGKGGDLGKWEKSRKVELYVGCDPADVSIKQARDRFMQMQKKNRRLFHGEFYAKDCFGEWLGDIPIIKEVGIDPGAGGGNAMSQRWGGGGWDMVTMMFCMHYAFESESKARGMLRNVAGALKKGGRFIEDQEDGEVEDEGFQFGNSIYSVKFPGKTPPDGTFRPPYGWKYSYWLTEAVEAPEYVVPWEAFRALAEDFNLELQYRKPFREVWEEQKDDPVLGPLSEVMKVRDRATGRLLTSDEELEAADFYHAFCFYKV
ncbi:mrna cap methyltransferase [Pyrenophora seminiperda CCB06]|uniref:mRNA cap guanine-N(7) methyltransferase n=1 Tax=Pyrenophora seminiperda CCB06 TaxID=1302712 RepID=A0A3M7M371_9PLEO|nr:mrna cap methyltransferase [Pyrenophora seminiperda CCB06]